MPSSKIYIVNDRPSCLAEGRDGGGETLADIIQTCNTPLTIGVFGYSVRGQYKTSSGFYCPLPSLIPCILNLQCAYR